MDSLSYNHLAPPSVFQKFSALIKHNTLVFMTFCWWLFWGVISLGTHKSLFPAPETVHLIVIFCSGLFIGTVFAPSPRTQAPAFANKFLKILRLQFLFLIVPALLGSIWLFWPAYQFYFVDHRPMIFLRDSFFNYGYENAYWFPSKYLWSGFIMVSGFLYSSF